MKKVKLVVSTIVGIATIGIASQQLYANSGEGNHIDSIHNSSDMSADRNVPADNALHPMLLEAMNHEATSAAFLTSTRRHGNTTQILRAERAWRDANGMVVSVLADLGGINSSNINSMHNSGMSYEQIGYELRIYQDQIVTESDGRQNDQMNMGVGLNDHGLDIHNEHMGDYGNRADYNHSQMPVSHQVGNGNVGHYQQYSSTGSSRSYGSHGMGH